MIVWWVSCQVFTVRVVVQKGTVVDAAPIVRKFIGQPFSNLIRYARKFGGLVLERLENEKLGT